MATLTKSYLDELKALLDQSTPGPWTSFVEGRDHESGSSFIRTPKDDLEIVGGTASDQDLIARARHDLPVLIAEIERLQSLLADQATAAE